MTRTARILCLVAVPSIVAAAASTAHGHARLKSPTPRDTRADYKSPPENNVGIGEPCGVARTAAQPSNPLTPGAQIAVTFEETITHNGCFVVDFSAGNDANFTILGVKSHSNPPAPTNPTNSNPRQWSVNVTLPSTPCTACTLRLRQLMLASNVADSACPPATVPAGATYYSCANVVLGGSGTGGTGGSSGGAGGGGGSSGGSAAGGRGGNAAGGRGGNAAGGRGGAGQAGTSGQAGDNGQAGTSGQAGSGAGQAGTSGQAGDNGQAGTSGQAGSGAGQAGTSGQAGSGASGASGQAGNGNSGGTGPTGTGQAGSGGGGDDGGGGCQIGGGATTAPLGLLLAAVLLRRRRRRSRS